MKMISQPYPINSVTDNMMGIMTILEGKDNAMKTHVYEESVNRHGGLQKRTHDRLDSLITEKNPKEAKTSGDKRNGCEGVGIFLYYGP
jgi:hypothetical protein